MLLFTPFSAAKVLHKSIAAASPFSGNRCGQSTVIFILYQTEHLRKCKCHDRNQQDAYRILRFFYLDIQNKKQSYDNYCNMYHDQEIESAISSHQIKERQDDRHGCDRKPLIILKSPNSRNLLKIWFR